MTDCNALEELGYQFSRKILDRADWRELKRQKKALIEAQVAIEKLDGYQEHYYKIEGLLNFLDAIQDFVTDHTEIPEEEVFDW
jgi:putative IMPACT (imprinted ancient) family translation regulator